MKCEHLQCSTQTCQSVLPFRNCKSLLLSDWKTAPVHRRIYFFKGVTLSRLHNQTMVCNPVQPEMSLLQFFLNPSALQGTRISTHSWYNIINSQRFVPGNDPEVKFSLFNAKICYHKRINTGERNSAPHIPVRKRTKPGPRNNLGLLRFAHFNTIKNPCLNTPCQNVFKRGLIGL